MFYVVFMFTMILENAFWLMFRHSLSGMGV
jgi:hypothetical protein